MEPLYLRQLKLGPMDNFVYLVGSAHSPEVLVVDPAWDVPLIEAQLALDQKKLAGIFATHWHKDHTNGIEALLSRHDVPVFAQQEEIDFSEELRKHQGALKPLRAGDAIPVGPAAFRALHTPGHTPGSQCLLAEGALVAGDTVFVQGCGRCDFQGSDPEAMYRSLTQVVARLPDPTRLWPGHDYGPTPSAEMSEVREHNPYFGFKDMEAFVAFRMRPRK